MWALVAVGLLSSAVEMELCEVVQARREAPTLSELVHSRCPGMNLRTKLLHVWLVKRGISKTFPHEAASDSPEL